MTYQDFRKAVAIFQLEERATLKQIRARFRTLVKHHHPDHAKDADQNAIREINWAYEMLMDYCSGYQFCFSEEEFLHQTPSERLKRQFSWDPVWGGRGEHEQD